MTFDRLSDMFVSEYIRRTGTTKPGDLFSLQNTVYGFKVVSADHQNPDAAIARTRSDLAILVPELVDLIIEPNDYGCGEPIAWLWEATGPALIRVCTQTPDYQVGGAVSTALAWVW